MKGHPNSNPGFSNLERYWERSRISHFFRFMDPIQSVGSFIHIFFPFKRTFYKLLDSDLGVSYFHAFTGFNQAIEYFTIQGCSTICIVVLIVSYLTIERMVERKNILFDRTSFLYLWNFIGRQKWIHWKTPFGFFNINRLIVFAPVIVQKEKRSLRAIFLDPKESIGLSQN